MSLLRSIQPYIYNDHSRTITSTHTRVQAYHSFSPTTIRLWNSLHSTPLISTPQHHSLPVTFHPTPPMFTPSEATSLRVATLHYPFLPLNITTSPIATQHHPFLPLNTTTSPIATLHLTLPISNHEHHHLPHSHPPLYTTHFYPSNITTSPIATLHYTPPISIPQISPRPP